MKDSILQIWRSQRPASVVVIAAALILIFFTFYHHRLTTNPRSRIITVERLLEAGTLAHVSAQDTTPFQLSEDAIRDPESGNIYSSKPPLYSIHMAGTAYPVKWITGWNFFEHQVNYVRYLVLLHQVIPFVIILLLALWMGMKFTKDKTTLAFLMLAMTIGTLPFAYTVTINNHTATACWLFLSFFFVFSITQEGKDHWWRYITAGFVCGLAVAYELTAVAVAFVFLLALFMKNRPKAVVAILFAAIPILITGFFYQEMTGAWKPATLQSELFKFEGSYWNDRQGLDALRESKWIYTFHSLFGHHGFFSLTPILILVPIAWIGGELKKFGNPNSLFRLIGLASVAIMILIITITTNYGGSCMGMRWWILFTPLAVFSTLPVIEYLAAKKIGRIVMSIMIAAALPVVFMSFRYESFIASWLENWWGI